MTLPVTQARPVLCGGVICGTPDCAISWGLCHCGCGGKTSVASCSTSREGYVLGQPKPFLHHHNTRSGEGNPRWKGGRHVNDRGYVLLRRLDHPSRNHLGYVREHLLVAEAALGRPIPQEHPVHHVNEDPGDNRPGNLVICENQAYHALLHRRLRALRACGNPGFMQCKFCRRWDDPAAQFVHVPGDSWHRECRPSRSHLGNRIVALLTARPMSRVEMAESIGVRSRSVATALRHLGKRVRRTGVKLGRAELWEVCG